MNIYILIFILLVICSNLEFFLNKKNLTLMILVTLVLGVFAGLRSPYIGTDTITYYNSFWSREAGTLENDKYSVGYTFISKLFFNLHLSANMFFFTFSVITLFLIGLFFEKASIYPVFSLTYYYARFFLARDMNQIRQSLAAAICLYALKYIMEKDLKKFTLVVLIASSIHYSAFLMFILYFVINKIWRENKRFFFLKVIIEACILSGMSFVIKPILSLIFNVLNMSQNYLTYSGYVTGNGLLNPVLLFQISMSLIMAYIINYIKISNKDTVLFKAYIIGTFILLILNQFYVLGGRASTIIVTIEPLVVFEMFSILFSKKVCFMLYNLITIAVYILIYTSLMGDIYLPYRTFFQI